MNLLVGKKFANLNSHWYRVDTDQAINRPFTYQWFFFSYHANQKECCNRVYKIIIYNSLADDPLAPLNSFPHVYQWYLCEQPSHLQPEGNILHTRPHPLPEVEDMILMLLMLRHVKEGLLKKERVRVRVRERERERERERMSEEQLVSYGHLTLIVTFITLSISHSRNLQKRCGLSGCGLPRPEGEGHLSQLQ